MLKSVSKILIMIAFTLFCCITQVFANDGWGVDVYIINNGESDYNTRVQKTIIDCKYKCKNIDISVGNSSKETFAEYLMRNSSPNLDKRKILVVCGQGSGIYGIEDSDYGYLTLSDIKNDFRTVYGSNNKKTVYDIILFDAETLATLEAVSSIDGYAKYVISSQLYMNDNEKMYECIFDLLNEKKEIDTKTVGKAICDIYMDTVKETMVDKGQLINTNISLVDVKIASNLFKSLVSKYKKYMKRVGDDSTELSKLSRIFKRVLSVGNNKYEESSNLIDCGSYIENMVKYMPFDFLYDKLMYSFAVKYKNNTNIAQQFSGISIFFPRIKTSNYKSEIEYYCDNIAHSNFAKIFCLYKLTGNITKEFENVLKLENYKVPHKLNYNNRNEYKKIIPDVTNGLNYTMSLNDDLNQVVQDVSLVVYRREPDVIKYYNSDHHIDIDTNGNIKAFCTGMWTQFAGVPVFTTIQTRTNDYCDLLVSVIVNQENRHYLIRWDINTNVLRPIGLIEKTERSNLLISRLSQLKYYDDIGIPEVISGINKERVNIGVGNYIIYDNTCKFEEAMLPDGEYSTFVQFEDLSGAHYDGSEVLFNIENGHIKTVIEINDLIKQSNNWKEYKEKYME